MFKSIPEYNDQHNNRPAPKSIDVDITYKNSDAFSARHILADTLNALLPNEEVNVLSIRGIRVCLCQLISLGGNDDLFVINLPRKLNRVKELNIKLYQNRHYYNSIDGRELSILLGALPNIETLTIACSSIENYVLDIVTGRFNFEMRKVHLPNLKSCTFTTAGTDFEGKPRAVHPEIISCLLASAPQLTREAIKLLWTPEEHVNSRAFLLGRANGFHQAMHRTHNLPAHVVADRIQPFLRFHDQLVLSELCHPASDADVIANRDNSAADRSRFDKRFGLLHLGNTTSSASNNASGTTEAMVDQTIIPAAKKLKLS